MNSFLSLQANHFFCYVWLCDDAQRNWKLIYSPSWPIVTELREWRNSEDWENGSVASAQPDRTDLSYNGAKVKIPSGRSATSSTRTARGYFSSKFVFVDRHLPPTLLVGVDCIDLRPRIIQRDRDRVCNRGGPVQVARYAPFAWIFHKNEHYTLRYRAPDSGRYYYYDNNTGLQTAAGIILTIIPGEGGVAKWWRW